MRSPHMRRFIYSRLRHAARNYLPIPGYQVKFPSLRGGKVGYCGKSGKHLLAPRFLKLGYKGGAVVFAIGLAIVAAAYFYAKLSHTFLFWAAFILTRPLGATLGDLLDKPHDEGGLEISRYVASGILAAIIVTLILIVPQRAGMHPGASEQKA